MREGYNPNTYKKKLKKYKKRQGGRCYYCNVKFDNNKPSLRANIDHIIPFCQVGNDTKQVASCRRCNMLKGNISEELYRDGYICVNHKYSYDGQSVNLPVKVRKPINWFQKTFPNIWYWNKPNYQLTYKLYE